MHAAKDARPAMHGIIYLQPQGRVNGRRTPSCGDHASMMHAAVVYCSGRRRPGHC
jgi:hypothetical protein